MAMDSNWISARSSIWLASRARMNCTDVLPTRLISYACPDAMSLNRQVIALAPAEPAIQPSLARALDRGPMPSTRGAKR
jgi:hypothetical protein